MAVPPHPIRVPVWQVTKESYRSVFMHPIIFVRIAWLPALLFFTVAGGLVFAFERFVETYTQLRGHLAEFIRSTYWLEGPSLMAGILLMMVVSVFAVRWHRFQLRGEVWEGTTRLFGKEWRRFVAYILLIWSPNLALELLKIATVLDPTFGHHWSASLVGAAFTIAWLVVLVSAYCCALVFPAAAYGQPLPWLEAWRYLRGNFWRLVACCVFTAIISILTCVPIIFLLMVPIPISEPAVQFGLTAIMTVFKMILVAVFASVLCGFYRRIVLRYE